MSKVNYTSSWHIFAVRRFLQRIHGLNNGFIIRVDSPNIYSYIDRRGFRGVTPGAPPCSPLYVRQNNKSPPFGLILYIVTPKCSIFSGSAPDRD